MAHLGEGLGTLQRLGHQRRIDVRAEEAIGRDRAGHVAEHVILAVRIAHHVEQGRVRGDHVIGLHESLLRHLPVAAQLLGDVHRLVAPLERDRLEVPVDVAEVRHRQPDGGQGHVARTGNRQPQHGRQRRPPPLARTGLQQQDHVRPWQQIRHRKSHQKQPEFRHVPPPCVSANSRAEGRGRCLRSQP